jgi:hypothetical protein
VTLADVLRRYPFRTGLSLLGLSALALTLLFWAGVLPVTRSLSTFAQLVSFTLFIVVAAAAAWIGPVVGRLRR